MFLGKSFETNERFPEKLQLVLNGDRQKLLEEFLLGKGNTKVSRIDFRSLLDLVRAQMTDHLMPEDLDGDSVVVATCDSASQLRIEVSRLIQVRRRYCQMKNSALMLSHGVTSCRICM